MANALTATPPPFIPNVQSNAHSLYYVKSTTASLSGATAGILGLTDAAGFSFYILTSLLVGLTFQLANCGGKPGRYFEKKGDVLVGGILDNLFAYVLFWTLFYALVHIYD